MSELRLYIKDRYDGTVRRYGESRHDSLRVVKGVLTYENLQNGDGSPYGYCFCNEDGSEDWLDNFPAEEYLHIGEIAVDAVEVVRCKDCKRRVQWQCNVCGKAPFVKDDGFCSFGGRREGNEID